MVVSPFYHYGMYSEVMNVKTNYPVLEVEVNSHMLMAKDFSPQQWDKIVMPLNYYAGINKSNALYNTDIKRLISKFHVAADGSKFLQNCDSNNFIKWYSSYLESMINQKVDALNIHWRNYQFKSGLLQATNSIIPLAQACN